MFKKIFLRQKNHGREKMKKFILFLYNIIKISFMNFIGTYYLYMSNIKYLQFNVVRKEKLENCAHTSIFFVY